MHVLFNGRLIDFNIFTQKKLVSKLSIVFFRVILDYVRFNESSAGLEPPAAARNKRKATVKIHKNPR